MDQNKKRSLLERMMAKPKKAIRQITGQEDPFERPQEGSERYEAFKKAFEKRDEEEKRKKSMYELINRRARQRLENK